MKNYTLLFLLLLGISTINIKGQGSEPLLGQILYVSFNTTPRGYANCDGQLMSIIQNQALFSLIGTTYGGNGTSTFALPDIQSRVILGDSPENKVGSIGGEETHTLTIGEMPAHSHLVNAVTTEGNKSSPQGNLPADTKILDKEYAGTQVGNLVNMNPYVVNPTGGGQVHNNMQPYITFRCIIAIQGLYPTRD